MAETPVNQEIETEFDNAVDSIRELSKFLSYKASQGMGIDVKTKVTILSSLAVARSIIALATTVDVRGRETIEAINRLGKITANKSL